MNKRAKDNWPAWKIATVAIACIVVGTAFFIAYTHVPAAQPITATQPAPEKTPGNSPVPTSNITAVGLGNLLVLLGLVSWGVGLSMAGWLGYKMYMRIPAWRRRQFLGKRR